MERRDNTRQDTCRLRKAIRELLAKHPEGLSQADIFNILLKESKYAGTRRNLEFQGKAILQAMIDRKDIANVSESGDPVFKSRQ